MRAPRPLLIVAALSTCIILTGCHAGHRESGIHAGHEKTGKPHAKEPAAAMLQDRTPVDQIHAHVCGFHFYNGQMGRQVEAHHYCSHLNDEMLQCVIYDGPGKDARLIGIEYIISERLFKTLSDEERKLWHSHAFEVKGGLLTAPGLPPKAELGLMKDLVSTYGKTVHTWQVDRGDALPLGVPQIMMGFVEPGQIKPELLQGRDRKYGVETGKLIRDRADIPTPAKVPGADAWTSGRALQLQAIEVKSPTTRPVN